MQIAVALFPEVTALDAIGPYEVLQRLPGATVTFVGAERGNIRTDNGFLGLSIDATFAEVPRPDVVVVPGGVGTRPLMAPGAPILEWVRQAHETSRFTTSVCTGSLVLGAAGLLDGLTATTHWGAYGVLAEQGAIPTGERVVEHLDERIITAAGVSAGLDMALRLSELLVDADAARAMQLMIEYDPQPPFDAGSVAAAGDAVMARVVEYAATKK
jgi:putative intracellular protease/amidase